jgi:GNAT superfamily N-acetyltransferase
MPAEKQMEAPMKEHIKKLGIKPITENGMCIAVKESKDGEIFVVRRGQVPWFVRGPHEKISVHQLEEDKEYQIGHIHYLFKEGGWKERFRRPEERGKRIELAAIPDQMDCEKTLPEVRVHKDFRDMGIGSLMLAYLRRDAQKNDCVRIDIKHPELKLKRFYEKHGFHRQKTPGGKLLKTLTRLIFKDEKIEIPEISEKSKTKYKKHFPR